MESGIDLFTVARVILLACAFTGFAIALTRMRREQSEQLGKLLHAQAAQEAQILTIAERMSALATLVATLAHRTEPLSETARAPVSRREPQPRSYETAKRLVRSGASVSEIVSTCGLADAEARLLLRLHGAELQRDSAA